MGRSPAAAAPPLAGRRPGRAHARPRQPALAALIVFTLLAAACTDDPAPAAEPPPPNEPAHADDNAAASDPDTPEQPADHDEADLLAAWEGFHTAWIGEAAADDPDPAAFDGLALDPDATLATLIAQRGDARLTTTEAELWPTISADEHTGTATIDDCAIVTQHPQGQPNSPATVTLRWEASAVVTEEGWRIDAARPVEMFCVASALNDQLLAAYREYRAVLDDAWDPPDPGHPGLEAVMSGEHLEFIRELLVEHERDGIVIREPAPTDDAVVFDVGIGTATVSDCTEQVAEYGAFDLTTGARLDDLIPQTANGQLDLQSVELSRDGGGWRVVEQGAARDTNCIKGSTRYVVS